MKKGVLNKFGNMVRQKRLARGLSQEELGRRIDMSRASISLIEIGKINFRESRSKDTLEKIAGKLNLDFNELLALRPNRKINKIKVEEGTPGGTIAQSRIKKGLTQGELAALIGKSGGYISGVEKNRISPPARVMAKIRKVLR